MSWHPLLLSLQVAVAATGLAGLLGVALAALLARPRLPGRDLIDVLVTAPMVLPPTVLGYYLLVLLGRTSPVGQAFEAVTGISIVFTPVGAVVAATLGALPLVVKSTRAALEAIDPTLVQAARTLGATPLRAFVTVELPLAVRGVIAGLMLGFARALGDFGVTLMVAGNIPGETRTASLAIYTAIQAGKADEAHTFILLLTVVGVVPLYVATKLGRRAHG